MNPWIFSTATLSASASPYARDPCVNFDGRSQKRGTEVQVGCTTALLRSTHPCTIGDNRTGALYTRACKHLQLALAVQLRCRQRTAFATQPPHGCCLLIAVSQLSQFSAFMSAERSNAFHNLFILTAHNLCQLAQDKSRQLKTSKSCVYLTG